MQSLEQPRPIMEMKQVRPQLSIEHKDSMMQIDQERAWDALALGKNMETMNKIYSMASDMALQGLARIVDNGNRLADLLGGGNPIAEFALDWKRTFPEFDFRGPASVDNVDISFTPAELSFDVERGRIDIHTEVQRPVHEYTRGALDIYVQQYARVDITPPLIDARI